MIFGSIVNLKFNGSKRSIHSVDAATRIWHQYYENVSPPPVIQGDNKNVTATANKCFTYICKFVNLESGAVNFTAISSYSILLCENTFYKGPGTVYITSSGTNSIVIDKFCSFESNSSTYGHFTYFHGDINSTILQGTISHGGNRDAYYGMIYQQLGDTSLSNTNITNCISQHATAFMYWSMESTTKVKFCNFENLEATNIIITCFEFTVGIVERCNYINNSQTDKNYGLVHEYNKRLDVLDSVFRDNLKNKNGAIFSTISGQIYIFNCSIDTYSQSKNGGTISTSEMPTKPFSNDLKFIGISPCEGSLLIAQNKDKKDSIYKNIKLLSLINFFITTFE